MNLKKTILLIIILLAGLVVPNAMADEGKFTVQDMHDTLAQGTAKGFLMSVTNPDLIASQDFYLASNASVPNTLRNSSFNSFEIVSTKLIDDTTHQTTAQLNPGEETVLITSGWHDGRWRVEAVSLNGTEVGTDTNTDIEAGTDTNTDIEAGTDTNTDTEAGTDTNTDTEAGTATNTQPTRIQPTTAPAMNNGLQGQIVFQAYSGGPIYVINANGTGLRKITTGMDPQISPDGTQLVFTRWEPEYALYTINIDGTNERKIVTGWRQMKSPSWSADGNRVVFSYQDGGRLNDEIHHINWGKVRQSGSGKSTRIPDVARDIETEHGITTYRIPMDAYWHLQQIDLLGTVLIDTPTGSRYSYGSSFHPQHSTEIIYRGDRGLGLYDTNSQTSRSLTTDYRDKAAVISPDGTKIALSYWQEGHWEVHVLNSDGTGRQRLTETPMRVTITEKRSWNNAAPAWSPDGQHLLFITDRTGEWEVWTMGVDGSNQQPMFTNGALDGIEFEYGGVDERMFSWK
ncbi:hypothetical protein QUF58_13930 [Anaerolineales bacterium HSG24]|nr:hypothetical protein [Anaerolineales bacterium HSG24]